MAYKKTKQYRLKDFDYSGEGEYFVTICTDDCKKYFGKINDGNMILSPLGKTVERIWNEIPKNFNNIALGIYQVMPDHFQGIVVINKKSCRNFNNEIPTFRGIKNNPMELKSISLGRIIRCFKARVKYEAANINSDFKWQSRFYDRIIRNEREFYFISEYIQNNPLHWGNRTLKEYFHKNP